MLIIGHRGAAALEPENTLRSIARAIEIGADAVEIDVRLSKDGEIVVIHDATVDRTTNGKGTVSSYTLEEIKRLDAGKGEKIPTLQEVIDFIDNRVGLVIELKSEEAQGAVVKLIQQNRMEETVYVISFWHRLVKRVKEIDSQIKTAVLFAGCPVDTCVATHASADALLMHYGFVDQRFVAMAHSEGVEVFVWNIDDRSLLEPYAQMGVDGIGSNDPGQLVAYFR
jgi:glycerophosphoryl diester phosphodiesterase